MSRYTGTIPLSGQISPRDTRDDYPTHSDEFVLGGYRSVLTLTDRDNIPSERRKNGMIVYVVEEEKSYILKENSWVDDSVQITVQSLDDSVVFDDVENIKIDTNSGLGLNRNANEPGTAILTSQQPFSEFTDSNGDNISANNTETVKFKETNTIIPKIQGNSVIFNTKTFSYKSTSPSVQHLIVHNLGTDIIIVNIYLVNDNGSMDYTVIPYTISDLNTIELTLSVAKNVMVNIIPLEPIQ
jgi:hypothetical protein